MTDFIKKTRLLKIRSYIKQLIIGLNIIAIIMLLLSYLALYVSPEKIWILAFFGLSYPVLLLANLFFMLIWMVFGKRYFLLSLVAVLLGFNIIKSHLRISLKKEDISEKGWFKVMSYNTRLFDYYNWKHSEESKNLIIDYLQKESPDILCLQEFYSDDSDKYPILSSLQSNRTKYSHVDYFLTQKNSKHYGLATLSTFPIIAKGKIQPDPNSHNYTIFTDILINQDTIRVFNIHLPSIRFDSKDFLFISGITSIDNRTNKELKEGSVSVIKKLKNAFQKRARHVEIISEQILASPFPVIVCGDFNDTPSSYAYKRISRNLTDSFIESGSGFGKTYSGRMPSFRIDYLFHDNSFKGTGFKTGDVEISDHYPIYAYMKLVDQLSE